MDGVISDPLIASADTDSISDTSDDPLPEFDNKLREPLFANVLSVHQSEVDFNKERKRAGWWVGACGLFCSALSSFALVVVVIYHQPQIQYREIDPTTGLIRASHSAKDAPTYFPEQTIHRYIAEYVELRNHFVWQDEPNIDHRVKIMSSAEEQKNYADEKKKTDLGAKYGMAGFSRVVSIDTNSFLRRGVGKDKTLEYDVQFIKGEVFARAPNTPVETHMTARILFQFHPEAKMSDRDRLNNEAGMMVISYHDSPDR
jgi:type IV secretory pathway component VirB8